jgi:hypothetical protein
LDLPTIGYVAFITGLALTLILVGILLT